MNIQAGSDVVSSCEHEGCDSAEENRDKAFMGYSWYASEFPCIYSLKIWPSAALKHFSRKLKNARGVSMNAKTMMKNVHSRKISQGR